MQSSPDRVPLHRRVLPSKLQRLLLYTLIDVVVLDDPGGEFFGLLFAAVEILHLDDAVASENRIGRRDPLLGTIVAFFVVVRLPDDAGDTIMGEVGGHLGFAEGFRMWIKRIERARLPGSLRKNRG